MFKVNIRKIRTWCEICAKLTIMTSSVSMVNFEPVGFLVSSHCSKSLPMTQAFHVFLAYISIYSEI